MIRQRPGIWPTWRRSTTSRSECCRFEPGFRSEPTIVLAENYTGGMYFEERGDVDRYRAAHLTSRDAALGADISRTLLREAARSFENER
ncbi:Scr1 family TA system antitoxin-like transcriptional regulator [Nocardia tengchongensis]